MLLRFIIIYRQFKEPFLDLSLLSYNPFYVLARHCLVNSGLDIPDLKHHHRLHVTQ